MVERPEEKLMHRISRPSDAIRAISVWNRLVGELGVIALYAMYSDADFYAQTSGCTMDDDMVKYLSSPCYVKIVLHHL